MISVAYVLGSIFCFNGVGVELFVVCGPLYVAITFAEEDAGGAASPCFCGGWVSGSVVYLYYGLVAVTCRSGCYCSGRASAA